MTSPKDIIFEVGSRYRNKRGWYEVLEIEGEHIHVQYEGDEKITLLSIETQQRIVFKLSQEEVVENPTPFFDEKKNRDYFQTLGYLTNNGFIEAIIPPKSQQSFDDSFSRIKGRYPRRNGDGYYVHHDHDVDKWGTEMRLTFKIPTTFSLNDLEFGSEVNIVDSPNSDELRVNSNDLCWNLLSLGFELGKGHNVGKIQACIPEAYKPYFQHGREIA